MEVRNRLKGLDLINRAPEEISTKVHDIVQEAVIKTIPKKKKCKKAKWLFEEALQIVSPGACPNSCPLSEQCKETEENNRMGKTGDLFKKLEIPREHFMERLAQ